MLVCFGFCEINLSGSLRLGGSECGAITGVYQHLLESKLLKSRTERNTKNHKIKIYSQ